MLAFADCSFKNENIHCFFF